MRAVFLKFLKKCSQLRCTGLLRSSKLVQLDDKKLVCFTANLTQNLMNLVFFLSATGRSQKMAKTKAVQKTANWRRSEAKG